MYMYSVHKQGPWESEHVQKIKRHNTNPLKMKSTEVQTLGVMAHTTHALMHR